MRRPLSVKDTGECSASTSVTYRRSRPNCLNTWKLLHGFFTRSRWKTHKWRRCQLVPWSVRQDSPGAQETCGPGMQVRGMARHSHCICVYEDHLNSSSTSQPGCKRNRNKNNKQNTTQNTLIIDKTKVKHTVVILDNFKPIKKIIQTNFPLFPKDYLQGEALMPFK